jgi:hypothetical protein
VIRGEFNDRRPYVSGFLSFGFSARQIQVEFVIDTGSDISLLGSDAYEDAGLSYDDFAGYPPATSAGFGGQIAARRAPARLFLFDSDERNVVAITLEIEVLKPVAGAPLAGALVLPSIIGRDVTDLFRLTIDRSVNLVTLEPRGDPNWRP